MTGWFPQLLAQSRFLQRYPLYAGILAKIEAIDSKDFPYMAVSLYRLEDKPTSIRLYCNADYFRDHSEHFAGVLQHEIHHCAYGHLELSAMQQVDRPFLLELAMEMSANEDIVEPSPGPGVMWQQFKFCGVSAKQSTIERYRLLQEAEARGDFMVVSSEELDASFPRWRERQNPDDADYDGPRIFVRARRRGFWSNSPAEVITPRIHDDHRPGRGGKDDTGLGDALDRGHEASEGAWGRRFGLGSPTGVRQIEAWRLRIQEHLAAGSRGSGADAPGAWRPVAKGLPRTVVASGVKGGMAWSRILRALLLRRRAVQPTWLRPNRRFPQRLGEVPGRQRRPFRPNLLAAIDTSASVGEDVLGRIAGELLRLAAHARVTVVEFDAAVQRIYPLRSVTTMFGGGDTSYVPVIALTIRERHWFDGVVCFTDGAGMWPRGEPVEPAMPWLWVLTNGDPLAYPYGMVARLSV